MQVRDWMTSDPIVATPDTEVREARRLLHANGIRHLPVVGSGRLVGIVSDRDVRIDDRSLRQLAALERLGDVVGEGKPLEVVMSSPPYVVGPDESVSAAARQMLSRRISALPVVEDGALIGILTTTDCLLALLAPQQSGVSEGVG